MKSQINKSLLKPGECIDDLGYAGLRIIQPKDRTRFGADAVLLANFCTVRPEDRIVDLGTGTGIIALLLAGRHPKCHIDALEIRPDVADRAKRSVLLNGLDKRIIIHECDLRSEPRLLKAASYHQVVCNPPYYKIGHGKISPNPDVAAARHELYCTLKEAVWTASILMREEGRFSMVCPAARYREFVSILGGQGLSIASIRPVRHSWEKPVILYLTEAVRGTVSPVMMNPLIQYEQDGSFTEEMKRIYHMND